MKKAPGEKASQDPNPGVTPPPAMKTRRPADVPQPEPKPAGGPKDHAAFSKQRKPSAKKQEKNKVATFKVVSSHALPKEEALQRVKDLIAGFAGEIKNLKVEWTGFAGKFSGSAKGFDVKSDIEVRDALVHVTGECSFLAKSRIESFISEKLKEVLSKPSIPKPAAAAATAQAPASNPKPPAAAPTAAAAANPPGQTVHVSVGNGRKAPAAKRKTATKPKSPVVGSQE